ncbi:MAG: hypothetical protein IJ055_06710, partial [Oscillospiraceae bacterium]|nr:hypothetical protein [Oscillospiraceae bacterium]
LKAARRGAFHLIGRVRFFVKKRPSSKNSPPECFLNSPLKKAAGRGFRRLRAATRAFSPGPDQLFEKSGTKNFYCASGGSTRGS